MSALTWLRRTFTRPPAPLVGFVFSYDLPRTTRRGRYFLTLMAYALFLLLTRGVGATGFEEWIGGKEHR